MRKLVYVVGGKDVTSYKRARELQPTGQLQTRLDEQEESAKVDSKMRAKRLAYFTKKVE